MIEGAVFCPNPPALLPDVASGAAAELAPVRTACVSALRLVTELGTRLVLIGAVGAIGPSAYHPPTCRGSLAGFGVPIEVALGSPDGSGEIDLPLSLTVGAWLVREALGARTGAIGFSIGPDFTVSQAAAELAETVRRHAVVLVVMADGSARRSTSAPGYLDERAAAFDATVGSALAGGDPTALRELDATLGAELLAAGVPAWHVAGELMAGRRFDAQVLYDGAPYGVGYFVAAWSRANDRG